MPPTPALFGSMELAMPCEWCAVCRFCGHAGSTAFWVQLRSTGHAGASLPNLTLLSCLVHVRRSRAAIVVAIVVALFERGALRAAMLAYVAKHRLRWSFTS